MNLRRRNLLQSIGAAGLCGLEGHAVSLNVLTLNGVQPSLKTLASGG